jgi:hypothetical protein
MIGIRRRRGRERRFQASRVEAGVLGALVCGFVAGGVVLAKAGGPPPDDAARTGVELLSVARQPPTDEDSVANTASEPVQRVTAIEGGRIAPVEGVARSDTPSDEAPTADRGEAPSAEPAQVPQIAPDAGPPAPIEPAPVEPAPIEPAPVEPQPIDDTEPPQGCGLVSCAAGYTCCNMSCGICVSEGETCDPTQCQGSVRYPVSTMCGQNTCSAGQACCNPTCGTCVAAGESCDQTPCTPRIQVPVSMMCGQNTCSVGQVCCNPTCGTCVAEGESCDETPCTPRIRYF